MKSYSVLFIILSFSTVLMAQSIRKDHREMIGLERDAYVQSLFAESDLINGLGNFHDSEFEDIHDNFGDMDDDIFLPWHRYMIFELEQELQNHCKCLSIPYWFWPTDNSTSDGPGTIWEEEFLGQFDDDWGLNRDLGGPGVTVLASQAEIDAIQSIIDFEDLDGYSNSLERGDPHFGGHNWVGGTMTDRDSPKDPVFYLHHAMVDKLWQDWEEVNQGSFFNRSDMTRYDGTYTRPTDNMTLPSIDPNSLIDSRSLGVFYAENQLAELDEYTVTNSSKPLETFYYQYTIDAGTNFVVPDQKSGELISETEVVLSTGFTAEEGSDFSAIINDGDCDFTIYSGLVVKKGIVKVNESLENVYSRQAQEPLTNFDFKLSQSTKHLEVQIKNKSRIEEVRIHSMNGKLVRKVKSDYQRIPISDLHAGVYSLMILSTNKQVSGKLFVVN